MVAEKTQTSMRGINYYSNAAVSIGLLKKNDSSFSNSPLAEAWLIPGSDADISQSILLENAFYTRWGHLAEAVRTGNRPEENRRDEQPADWVRNFIYALYNSARPMALSSQKRSPFQKTDQSGYLMWAVVTGDTASLWLNDIHC